MATTRQTADEFRNKPELQQVFRLDIAQDLAGLAILRPLTSAPKPMDVVLPRAEMIFQPRESAANDKQDVGGVTTRNSCCGCTPTLGPAPTQRFLP